MTRLVIGLIAPDQQSLGVAKAVRCSGDGVGSADGPVWREIGRPSARHQREGGAHPRRD